VTFPVPIASVQVDENNWFPTGDVASIDSLGYMAITDRSKDVVKSGGEWISSIGVCVCVCVCVCLCAYVCICVCVCICGGL